MPEPSVAGQVPQTEVADTPPKADEPRTQTGKDPKDLMSFLDIPADVQGQLKPREALTELPGDIPDQSAKPPELPETEQPELPAREEPAPEEAEDEEEEPEQEPAAAQAEAPRLDKRQKRINRLTRQKSELQSKLDATYAQTEELRRKLTQYESQQQQAAAAGPVGPGRLGWITSEQQLAQEVAKADSIIEWCDANREGAMTGTGDQERYLDSEEISRWRREAEKLVLSAPNRRDEIRQFKSAKDHFDGLVKQSWPELLDKSSEDYQIGEAIRQQYPLLRMLPQGDYVVGLLVEGARSLDARNAKNGQAPKQQHRDIDERAFAPRVPISPHVANPPTRPATVSSKQRVNEAMDNLVKDVDGSAGSLAKAFGAMDAARPQQVSGRTPVRS